MGLDRREFIKTAAAGVSLAGLKKHAAFHPIKHAIPGRPARTPVKHIVVVMMENRSVDHYLGWYGKENPAFDGRQAMTVPDLRAGHAGQTVSTRSWGQKGLKNFHGRGFEDPSHGWDGGRAEFNGGRVDGWLHPRTGNDEFALGYYDDVDVPVFAQLVRDYQSYDRWFCSLMGPTEPNRYYLHSGQSGGLKSNDTPPEVAADGHREWAAGWDWPTMWDLYDRFNVSSGYYFGSLPDLGYWGARHVNRMRHLSHWYEACATGTLPAVSILCPFVTVNGFGNDDHPHADMRLGQAFLSDVTEAFMTSRHYKQGALVVTYDEWGGFFDHVAPPRVEDDRGTPKDPGGLNDFGQLGFRIPSSIVSPWTRRPGAVDHTVYEHASILRFIAENWNLPYLTKRVRMTNSIERAFGGFRSFDPKPQFAPYDAPMGTWKTSGVDALNDFINDNADNPGSLPLVGSVYDPPDLPLPPVPIPHDPIPGGSKKDKSGAEKLLEMGWFEKFKIRTDWKIEDSYLHSRPELIKAARPR
ncbi:MAG: phospholipase [Actinomycetota bacterium]|jgi:phospholipase C